MPVLDQTAAALLKGHAWLPDLHRGAGGHAFARLLACGAVTPPRQDLTIDLTAVPAGVRSGLLLTVT